MTPEQKQDRYERIRLQLAGLYTVTDDPIARMATASALLYHKMGHFFWIGFYRLIDGDLLVGPYQGTVACQKLDKDRGVCRASVHQNRTIIVPDVHQFAGHIACDSRSQSEIVTPVRQNSRIMGVLDADSDKLNSFDEIDAAGLEKIAALIYAA
jgi:L-methionine (R)-S-oxide reductase